MILLFFHNNMISKFRYKKYYTKFHLKKHLKGNYLFVYMNFQLMGLNGVEWGNFRL